MILYLFHSPGVRKFLHSLCNLLGESYQGHIPTVKCLRIPVDLAISCFDYL